MARGGGISLRGLIRRLLFSFFLALAGSWGLIVSRLNLVDDIEFFQDHDHLFYFDLVSLTLFFFGALLIIYYRWRLGPRLERIESLGEANW